jgi:hypothetical protein
LSAHAVSTPKSTYFKHECHQGGVKNVKYQQIDYILMFWGGFLTKQAFCLADFAECFDAFFADQNKEHITKAEIWFILHFE